MDVDIITVGLHICAASYARDNRVEKKARSACVEEGLGLALLCGNVLALISPQSSDHRRLRWALSSMSRGIITLTDN